MVQEEITEDECRKCGACSMVLNYNCPAELQKDFFRKRGFTIVDNQAYIYHPCPNRGAEGCLIYENRPEICKMFPRGSTDCINARRFIASLK